MSIIQRILCPTDFSETSARATDYAEKLAIDTSAELILFHAFDDPAQWTVAGQEQPRDPHLLQQLAALLPGSAHKEQIRRLQHAGPAGEVICWFAENRRCDLIVMGTHGRTGLRHMLFGSVAEYVLRHARCPVLTIRDRDRNEPPLAEPRVLPIPAPRFM